LGSIELKVSDLSSSELAQRLGGPGIYLRTGVFTARIQACVPRVVEGLHRMYADYPVLEPGFADFHVRLARPRTMRRWFAPQVQFLLDDFAVFKPLPLDQAFPMLEWGLNWCISSHAHRYLMIHAAVVEKDGHAAILPAPPGSGKSTLCAALVHRGWRLLSDELTLVRISDGKIVPVPRPVSLKNGSIEVMKKYVPGAVFSREVFDTTKGTVAHMRAPSSSVTRAAEVAEPAWVVFPRYEPGSAAQLEALPRAHGFMQVADNAFNYSELGVKGFETLARLIDASQCYRFTYSVLDEAIETFAGLKTSAPIRDSTTLGTRSVPAA
jgi:HprK-related kinase A